MRKAMERRYDGYLLLGMLLGCVALSLYVVWSANQ